MEQIKDSDIISRSDIDLPEFLKVDCNIELKTCVSININLEDVFYYSDMLTINQAIESSIIQNLNETLLKLIYESSVYDAFKNDEISVKSILESIEMSGSGSVILTSKSVSNNLILYYNIGKSQSMAEYNKNLQNLKNDLTSHIEDIEIIYLFNSARCNISELYKKISNNCIDINLYRDVEVDNPLQIGLVRNGRKNDIKHINKVISKNRGTSINSLVS